jgi:hypothetical protein
VHHERLGREDYRSFLAQPYQRQRGERTAVLLLRRPYPSDSASSGLTAWMRCSDEFAEARAFMEWREIWTSHREPKARPSELRPLEQVECGISLAAGRKGNRQVFTCPGGWVVPE